MEPRENHHYHYHHHIWHVRCVYLNLVPNPWLSHSPSHHSDLKFIIPVLLGLIQIKLVGNQHSVFETHSALVWMFVGAILVYIIVPIAQPHFPNLSPPLQLISMLFASISLVFILFPPLKWELLASSLVSLFLLTIRLLLIKLFVVPNSRRDQTPILPVNMPNLQNYWNNF